MKPKNPYQVTYIKKNPWARAYYSSKGRAKKLGREHLMKVADFKELWFRDNAFEMKSPSIDRIDPSKGYVKSNCRYLERSENSKIGRLGMKDKPQTHCKHGHKLNTKNTYVYEGRRRCRVCRSIRSIAHSKGLKPNYDSARNNF